MKVRQISTSSGETLYDVDGTVIRLWIITGGTPCIAFEDYSYSERYPIAKDTCKWSDEHYNGLTKCYLHQNPDNIQGPDFTVLPEGDKTVEQYLATYLPKRTLADARFNGLPVRQNVYSKRIRDREERTIVRAELHIKKHYIGNVSLVSKWYAGHFEDKIPMFGKWWIEADKLFGAISERLRDALPTWDRLTDDEYKAVVKILSEKDCPATA